MTKAYASLTGLSVGDAFGDQFFLLTNRGLDPLTGSRITAQDTVPFTFWVVHHHLNDYEQALRACVQAGGDMDTTAAIVGGLRSG